MKHAIIIPLFNKAAYITHTLNSLIRQSKLPDELIIVDDLSTDNSLSLVYDFLRDHILAFGNCRIQVIERTENSPIIGKKELIMLLNDHFDLPSQEQGVYLVRSGGSTQKPLVFPVDIAENLEQRATLSAALLQAKVFTPKIIALNMFGYMDMYRTAAIMDDLLERCNATTLVASASLPYEDAYQMALNFKPDLLLGTPSKLFLFAQYLKKHQLRLSITNLLLGGEFLPRHISNFSKIFSEPGKFIHYMVLQKRAYGHGATIADRHYCST